MGDPLPGPPKLGLASLPLPRSGHPEAQRVARTPLAPMACLRVGRPCGRLRARPSSGVRLHEQAAARADAVLGSVRAGPPGRAEQHHGLLHAGQRAVGAPPAGPRHPGGAGRLRRLQVVLVGRAAACSHGAHVPQRLRQVRRAHLLPLPCEPGEAQGPLPRQHVVRATEAP